MPDLNAWKVVLILREGRLDSNETYYLDGSIDATSAQNRAVSMSALRIAMMPLGVSLYRIRISAGYAPYQTFLVDPTLYGGFPGWTPAPGEGEGRPDQMKAALQLDKYSGVRHQRGRFYLAGVPDLTLGGADDQRATITPASWAAALNVWKGELTANWKNRFRTDTTAGGLRIQVTQTDNAAPNGLFRIVLPTPDGTWAIGARVQLRKFTQQAGTQIKVNRVYQIVARQDATPAGGSTTLTLRAQQIPDSGQIIGLGTAELVAYMLTQITKVVPVEQTTRKRGNRSLAGPGRRPIRR
jgi:hypothetical protein